MWSLALVYFKLTINVAGKILKIGHEIIRHASQLKV